jgi:anionic cell wall polymer biosynthesis LytR-Cps2A-Psr (LCP) family protein
MSGKHRRPEADPLPEVDLAERLSAGPVVPALAKHAAPAQQAPRSASGPAPQAPRPASAPAAPSLAPAAPGPTVVARRDRAAARAARRRKDRQRLLVIGAGIAGIALIALGIYLMVRAGGGSAGPAASGPAKQRTTLVQVTGPDGTASATALVGTTAADRSAVAVLVPSRLIVDVAGSGEMPFGEAVTLDEPDASAGALTDLLGVSVTDSWVLTTDGLAALVDAVGGVQAAVDVDVVQTDAKGNQTVVVRAGNQTLKGRAAALYATYLADGEPEQARLARFDDVFSAVAEKLPEDATGIGAVLASLGEGSTTSLPPQALAKRLAVLRAAATSDSSPLVTDVLPVTELDTGASVPSYGLDAGQAGAIMRAQFAASLQKDVNGETVRVLVENGVGTPGLGLKARSLLVDAGFRYVGGGNASSFTRDPSTVLVPDGTDKSLDRGRRVAAALGLPASSVTPSDRGQTVADVIVILGSDFKP